MDVETKNAGLIAAAIAEKQIQDDNNNELYHRIRKSKTVGKQSPQMKWYWKNAERIRAINLDRQQKEREAKTAEVLEVIQKTNQAQLAKILEQLIQKHPLLLFDEYLNFLMQEN